MNRAMYAAASGMAAQQSELESIANDLANADVPGFKSSVMTFAAAGGDGHLGTMETGTHAVFTQGKLMRTGGPFDLAVDGIGFLEVERDGKRAYTRAGSFARGSDGRMRDADGWALRDVRVPADAIGASVTADGGVTCEGPDRRRHFAGRVHLAAFDDPERLRSANGTLFVASAESGAARELRAGSLGEPRIVFGALEKSNVSIIEAMMRMLEAQRAYEANSKGVQAADEMLRIADNIER